MAVTKPEDIEGLKLRTIQSPIYVAAINAMGANATPMAFNEVYTALQTGVLDGFEHAASMVYSAKLYEVSDHLALTRHLFGPTAMTYSLAAVEQAGADDQQVVQEGADFALEVARAMAPGREQEALQKLVEDGMTITEVDTSAFVAGQAAAGRAGRRHRRDRPAGGDPRRGAVSRRPRRAAA